MTAGGLLTFGETMAVFSTDSGRLRHASTVNVGIAGSESSVAIGVRRLGVGASWAGRVGADEPGSLVLARIRDEGVDVSAARTDQYAATGLMLKDFRAADSMRVAYYRHGSAGSRLCAEDLCEDRIRAAGVLHLSGITPALSESAADAVHAAIDVAQEADVPVSFDVNYRHALWPPEDAQDVLRELVTRADIVFAGEAEARLLGLEGSAEDLAGALAALGPEEVLVKLGPRGAVAELGGLRYDVPVYPVRAVDPEGAGDAFAAGYLADRLAGAPPDRRVRTAAACGAFAVSVAGDADALPDRDELNELAGPITIVR
ncbi:2-dehydro-3-deoxygluconokinase [Prauserella shujinwangii]|uniref:2-dehydro-3-deoxygluconokinase n=1 Tax=Prauserella shujinwangii TaxID=1453103 RepID=A0A2T0LYV1_9PSEU|nr:sugar kinase [Prauserella shujinwangii]PRX49270.1 2-dehydro-3-deoxygluconokinase [Prauserella shujinwangii]